MSDDKIVDFNSAAPSARLKQFSTDDKRAYCKHKSISVWRKEPIIECAACGAVVDPYWWLRERIGDWSQMVDVVQGRVTSLKREKAELEASVRILRGEFKDEAERQRARGQVAVLPPRRA